LDSVITISKRESITPALLFFAVVLAVWFFLPLISIILLLVLLYTFKFDKRIETFLFLLIAISLGLIAYTTKSVGVRDSDIARYFASYRSIASLQNFKGFFTGFLLWGNDNPLFYSITFIFTRVAPGNPQILPFFWGTVTYFFTFLSIRKCALYFSPGNYKSYILILTFSILGIITFFTITELLKQTASAAIFGYALLLKLNKQKHAIFFLVISVLVHFSSLFLLPAYFLARSKRALIYIPVIGFFSLVLSFFNFNELLGQVISFFTRTGNLYNRIQTYTNYETWTLSLRFYADFAMYFLVIVLLYADYFFETNEQLKNKKRQFLLVHSIAFCILLINRNNVHNFIRYVSGYFPFYIMAVIYLFNIRIAKNERVLILLLVLSFYVYSNFKLLAVEAVPGADYANSYMNNDIQKLLSSNVVQYFNFKVTGQ